MDFKNFKKQADPYGRGSYCIVVAMHGDSSSEAEILRSFRDNVMRRMPGGDRLINLYYRMSPKLVSVARSNRSASRLFSQAISGTARLTSTLV